MPALKASMPAARVGGRVLNGVGEAVFGGAQRVRAGLKPCGVDHLRAVSQMLEQTRSFAQLSPLSSPARRAIRRAAGPPSGGGGDAVRIRVAEFAPRFARAGC